jgi:DNA-directed RNA polymerase specialized sigma24 family protein
MGNKINAGNVDSFAPDKQKAGIEQLDLFIQQRNAAELSKEPELSLDEINAEIREAREEMRKRKSAKIR